MLETARCSFAAALAHLSLVLPSSTDRARGRPREGSIFHLITRLSTCLHDYANQEKIHRRSSICRRSFRCFAHLSLVLPSSTDRALGTPGLRHTAPQRRSSRRRDRSLPPMRALGLLCMHRHRKTVPFSIFSIRLRAS